MMPKPWPPQEVDTMVREYLTGRKLREIAAKLGRTRPQVSAQLQWMGRCGADIPRRYDTGRTQ